MQHYGALQIYHSPVKESSLSREGSGVQVLDQTRLVLSAGAKPWP